MVGQLAAGATLADARVEFDLISKRLEAEYPKTNKRFRALVVPYTAMGPGAQPMRLFLKILLAIALLALIVICANVANLVLSRAVFRQRELAIRQALGASRGRLFRLLLTEGLVLSLTAVVAAWLFANWAPPAILRLSPESPELDVTPDGRVAVYALLLAIAATVTFTVMPAVHAWRQHPLESLKAGEHTVAPARSRLSSVLAVLQLGLGVLLLTGAALLYRSSYLLDSFHPGFEKDRLLFVGVDTSGAAASREQNAQLLQRLQERLRSVPGVISVSYAVLAPLSWASMSLGPVQGDPTKKPVPADWNFVGPSYVQTLDVPRRVGREITEQDRLGAPLAAVINQNLAQALWPGESALGRRVLLPQGRRAAEIVGIVPNGAFSDIRPGTRRNMLFLAYQQNLQRPGPVVFHVRYAGKLDSLAPAIRAAVHETEVQAPVSSMRTAEMQLQATIPVKFIATLVTLFAMGALVVASIGLYAVIAFNMARRTREFAVRLTLGASSRQIWVAVLKEGLLLAVIGLGEGLGGGFALSLAVGRTLGSFLFGVKPTDPPTYLGVFILLGVTCVAACLLPARRATRIDPARALRQE